MKQKPKNPPREGRVDRARNAREGGEKDSPRADAPAERTSGAKRREERTRSAASPARVQKESPRVKNKKHTSTARKDTKRRGRVRDARHLRASPPRTALGVRVRPPLELGTARRRSAHNLVGGTRHRNCLRAGQDVNRLVLRHQPGERWARRSRKRRVGWS